MTVEKLDLSSPDLVQGNIEKIRALFPNVVTEGPEGLSIDFDALRQELSDTIVEGPQERYRLDWPGKRAAMLAANTPISKTLRPMREESVDFDTTQNLFIEGDNLDALKLLQDSYLGKVKMIYIDPPYNTGKDFIYKDNFTQDKAEYLEESGQVDEDGGRLVTNAESNGRFHSDWLSMMYPRLKLARNLLRDDGVIFISIGKEEVKNLISTLTEIFGEQNKVSILTWEKGRKNDSTFYSDSAEYMVVYAKNVVQLTSLGKWREPKAGMDDVLRKYEKLKSVFDRDHKKIEDEMRSYFASLKKTDKRKKLAHFYRSDDKGLYFGADISSASTSIPDYDIIHPTTKKPVKKPTRGWGATQPVMEDRISKNEVLFGEDENTIPLKKSYLVEVGSVVKTPVIYKDGRAASGVLKNLFGHVVFDNPKDHVVLADLISYCFQESKDSIVLDFFAGSSSTLHAVFDLNNTDGGFRRAILVQLPEVLDVSKATSPAARKTISSAIKFLQTIDKKETIAEISKERVRRAGKKILAENPDQVGKLDVGFRVLKIDSSNMNDVHADPRNLKQGELLDAVSHIKPDRSGEDLLFQVMLSQGIELSQSIFRETVEGKTVYIVGQDNLIACFDDNITDDVVKSIAGRNPLYAIFRDESFKEPADKINAAQIFKQLTEGHTRMKVI